ncbi:hypothetical protein DFH07DRAFT_1024893 [Mycena maculata]|uniref:Uncharacterized protein n=1 Tax=Mycena maculata TaxID=230809 RepID=A0AAD7J7Y8_9AGAR|nr:hypothetical protein DFH07DRAFT_1024893 [Mycena maculata]
MNSSHLSAPELPLYSPSTPSPCYSLDPANDETRLDLSPRMGTRPLPTGLFTKACGSATVVLFDQEDNIRIPMYGRRGTVRGSLILERDTSHISQIGAKLEGRLETTTVELGAAMTKVVKYVHSLWSRGSSSSPCPGTIEFAYPFPATFQHQGSEYPLPPSYLARFPGFPSLFARCTYNLTISITKDGRLLSKTKFISLPIDYNPQTSPPCAITRPSCFLFRVKTMPEEWYQSSFTMNTRSRSSLSPLQCQAFVPSVKIFGIKDSIPLHVQLSGSLAAFQEFVLPCSPHPGDADQGARQKSPVRVYITRMVSVEYRGKTTWRLQRIGEGHVWALPPTVNFDCDYQPGGSCLQTLDWDGEVKCYPDITVGGFQASGLTVKDFITLELVPPNPASSSLLTVQHAIPIRLVTETFVPPI